MTKIIMREIPAKFGVGEGRMYPHMLKSGSVGLDAIAADICRGTTFTPADVKGVVSALTWEISRNVADGKTVCIDSLGSFRPRLRLRDDAEREKRQNASRAAAGVAYISGISYRPSAHLLSQANEAAGQVRAARKRARDVRHVGTLNERRKAAEGYLKTYKVMAVADYQRLTGLGHTAAVQELMKWRQEAGTVITTKGRGSHKLYILKS